MEKRDYIIVGQGLAGTILAHILVARGKTVLLIDRPGLSSCSRISAGIFNPVVFKRLTKSWMANELLEFLVPFYKKKETLLRERLLTKTEIVRLFSSGEERKLWRSKRNEEVGNYLGEDSDDELEYFGKTEFGHASVKEAGHLNVQKFLAGSKEYFEHNGMFKDEHFDHQKLVVREGGVEYGGAEAKKIIFCEGWKGAQNPWFRNVKFNPVKGELLTVRMENYSFKKELSRGIFISNLGEGVFRVGSTFKWENFNDDASEEGKEELLDSLRKICGNEIEIIDHKAGVRPAVDDRRPVIGLHPGEKEIGIFNGMGSKGVMLAPYFADHFADHLENGTALNREVDVARFKFDKLK